MFLALAASTVSASPDTSALPGSAALQKLVNGAESWALLVAVLGAFVGAAIWAVSSHSQNHHYAARGRMAAVVSAGAALVIGAAPGIVNFFLNVGSGVK